MRAASPPGKPPGAPLLTISHSSRPDERYMLTVDPDRTGALPFAPPAAPEPLPDLSDMLSLPSLIKDGPMAPIEDATVTLPEPLGRGGALGAAASAVAAASRAVDAAEAGFRDDTASLHAGSSSVGSLGLTPSEGSASAATADFLARLGASPRGDSMISPRLMPEFGSEHGPASSTGPLAGVPHAAAGAAAEESADVEDDSEQLLRKLRQRWKTRSSGGATASGRSAGGGSSAASRQAMAAARQAASRASKLLKRQKVAMDAHRAASATRDSPLIRNSRAATASALPAASPLRTSASAPVLPKERRLATTLPSKKRRKAGKVATPLRSKRDLRTPDVSRWFTSSSFEPLRELKPMATARGRSTMASKRAGRRSTKAVKSEARQALWKSAREARKLFHCFSEVIDHVGYHRDKLGRVLSKLQDRFVALYEQVFSVVVTQNEEAEASALAAREQFHYELMLLEGRRRELVGNVKEMQDVLKAREAEKRTSEERVHDLEAEVATLKAIIDEKRAETEALPTGRDMAELADVGMGMNEEESREIEGWLKEIDASDMHSSAARTEVSSLLKNLAEERKQRAKVDASTQTSKLASAGFSAGGGGGGGDAGGGRWGAALPAARCPRCNADLGGGEMAEWFSSMAAGAAAEKASVARHWQLPHVLQSFFSAIPEEIRGKSMDWLYTQLCTIFMDKVREEEAAVTQGVKPQAFHSFLLEWLLEQHGVKRVAEVKLAELLFTTIKYYRRSVKARLFVRFLPLRDDVEPLDAWALSTYLRMLKALIYQPADASAASNAAAGGDSAALAMLSALDRAALSAASPKAAPSPTSAAAAAAAAAAASAAGSAAGGRLLVSPLVRIAGSKWWVPLATAVDATRQTLSFLPRKKVETAVRQLERITAFLNVNSHALREYTPSMRMEMRGALREVASGHRKVVVTRSKAAPGGARGAGLGLLEEEETHEEVVVNADRLLEYLMTFILKRQRHREDLLRKRFAAADSEKDGIWSLDTFTEFATTCSPMMTPLDARRAFLEVLSHGSSSVTLDREHIVRVWKARNLLASLDGTGKRRKRRRTASGRKSSAKLPSLATAVPAGLAPTKIALAADAVTSDLVRDDDDD